jgi:hypothetical protein
LATDRNFALLLLDAVMRVGETCQAGDGRGPGEDLFKSRPSLSAKCDVHRYAPFCAEAEASLADDVGDGDADAKGEPLPVFSVVHSVPGADRKPPSAYSLEIFATAPQTIRLTDCPSAREQRRRLDVPGVPGAFLMTNILSPRECARIVSVAEQIGYKPDAVDNIDNIVWLADSTFWQPLFARCEPLLPSQLGDCKLRGINARFRLFRYYPGAVYRPHIDGAWPGSGLVDGKFTDDAFAQTDRRYSKLTFLVYLNDVGGSGGGSTTFFLPNRERGFGHIEARSVEPRQGHVLCFPHGDAAGSLVHEGSAVNPGGVKYIIRSDVLYTAN